jgi:tRNA nucleotidyltransferase (CCA-adding enzyme)
MKPTFYFVGGAVRDKMIGRVSEDKDFVVEAGSYETMREAIIAKGGKIYLETPQYFTIRANLPDLGAADYVLARKDGAYKDGRHPESVTMGTILDDLGRRDFTMNAIAINCSTKEVIDPFDGKKDINSRLIRCVGDVNKRMSEDGLRGYRAMRFAITLGFQLSHSLESFLKHAPASIIENVSIERIRDEIYKMFHANTFAAVEMVQRYRFPWFQRAFGNNDLWLKPTAEKR